MNTRNQSWSEIRERYLGLPSDNDFRDEMLNLVEHISSSTVADGIYVWTSMFDLCITQTRHAPSEGEPHLRISPKRNQQIEFRYIDTYKTEKQWSRVVESKKSKDRFDKFIEQMHWAIKTK